MGAPAYIVYRFASLHDRSALHFGDRSRTMYRTSVVIGYPLRATDLLLLEVPTPATNMTTAEDEACRSHFHPGEHHGVQKLSG